MRVTAIKEMFRELSGSWELLANFTKRNLKVRYAQSVLGVAWAVALPVSLMVVFTFLFRRITHIDTGDIPYPIFVYFGLAPWTFFAVSLKQSTVSLVANANLVTKVYFPREVLPAAAVLGCLVDFGVALAFLGVLMAFFRITPSPYALLLPVVVIVQLAFTMGLALLLSAGNLFWRDIRYILEFVLTVWMFLTPVVYPIERALERIPTRLHFLFLANPMAPIIGAYRDLILHGRLPRAGPFAASAVVSFAVLFLGWYLFHRSEYRFAEVI